MDARGDGATQGKTPRPHAEQGNRIQDLRRQRSREQGGGLTQAVIAERIGVAVGTVTAWERGYQQPEGDNLLALARELRVSPRWIRDGVEDAPAPEPDAYAAELEGALDEIGEVLDRVRAKRRRRGESALRSQQLAREAREASTEERRAGNG